jgi:hypothetical protein
MLRKPVEGITCLVATLEAALPQDIQTDDTYSEAGQAGQKVHQLRRAGRYHQDRVCRPMIIC